MLEKGVSKVPVVSCLAEASRTFERYVQMEGMPERGGLLLGRIYPDEGRIELTSATEPSRFDRGTRCAWHRDAESSNRAIAEAWQESGGIVNYVGEWHTHPVDHPTPSAKDTRTMRSLVASGSLPTDFLILIIVGRKSIWAGYWTTRQSGPLTIDFVK